MEYPFNINKVEILNIDPINPGNGYVWFNSTEKLFKTYIDGELEIFIFDGIIDSKINQLMDRYFDDRKFIFSFSNTTTIHIIHNKHTKDLVCYFFDNSTNTQTPIAFRILNDDEVLIELVDPYDGVIVIQFI